MAKTFAQAQRMGAPRAIALCHSFEGALDFQTGRWPQAERALRSAIDLYREVGSASGESLSLQRLGVLVTARGEIDDGRKLLDQGVVVAERAAMRSHCLTRLHAARLRNRLAARDRDGMRECLAEGLATAERHGHCVTCNALLCPEVVRAAIADHDIDAADRHASALEDTARQFASRAWTAMAAHARGRVLFAQERTDEAFAALETARAAFDAIEQHYDAARCLRLLAACVSDTDPPRSQALRQQAEAVLRTLGAPGIED